MGEGDSITILLVSFLVVATGLVITYFVGNDKVKLRFQKAADGFLKVVLYLFFLSIVGVLLTTMYQGADKNGWFTHNRIASVWMPHDWLVGEFKSCVLASGEVTPVLDCSTDVNNSLHEMNVEFRGSLESLKSKKQSNWKCQREEDSIACKSE